MLGFGTTTPRDLRPGIPMFNTSHRAHLGGEASLGLSLHLLFYFEGVEGLPALRS